MNPPSSPANGNSGSIGGSILVVEDDGALRKLIVTVLERAGYAARAASSAEEALEVTREEEPTLVLTDVVLPGQSGYELCRILRDRFGETLPIIFVSGVRTEQFDVLAGFLLGADDYLTKPFLPAELVGRVRRALTRSAAATNLSGPGDGDELTQREREVLGLLAEGLSQKQIAARLVISANTVATHIQRILGKLGLHSRAEAVAWAYRLGMVADANDPALSTRRQTRGSTLRTGSS
jgi:DNA-binding NarL/FixJ family response regulator